MKTLTLTKRVVKPLALSPLPSILSRDINGMGGIVRHRQAPPHLSSPVADVPLSLAPITGTPTIRSAPAVRVYPQLGEYAKRADRVEGSHNNDYCAH
jgi:hypothetical protein